MLRCLAAVVVAVAALVAAACGDGDTTPANTFPTQADGGDEDEDFSAGVSIQCAPLDARVDIVKTALDDLDESGGPIADGRWVLTASLLVDDEAEADAGPSVVGQKAAVLSFAGNEVAWSSDTDVFGNAKADCCRGRYTVDGAELTLEVRCNDGNDVFVLGYGAGATVLRIRTTGNEYVDTYTKR